jgi:limonene-1,2-epoxide hydrolase
MYKRTLSSPKLVLERLQRALNNHDIEAFVSCLHPDYRSEQPVHPARAFATGDQARKNWLAIFNDMPDFHADLLRVAVEGDTVWSEWEWRGTHRDGTLAAFRGVTIFGVEGDHIVWGRLYMEPVEESGGDIDEAVSEWTAGSSK